MNTPQIAALMLAALCGAFGILYAAARRIDNYGIVDIGWSYALGLAAVVYAVFLPGWPPRRLAIGAMAAVWSLRLGTHLFLRIRRDHPAEDGRYRRLRTEWGQRFGSRMAVFFQLQAASVAALSVPFLAPCLNRAPGFSPLEWAGATLWLAALGGEALADAQLAAFRRDPSNRGRVCAAGLWRASRHPNYFFEWLIWVAYFVFATASPLGWIAILSPASILWLLLRVTGIPMTEEQALRSRGDAYRLYMRTTNRFIPWFPSKAHD
jgi:steroid 5-alpha reductase family enzyme